MPIATDTAIDYTNKIIDVTGSTVYDVSVLYSYCKEQFKLSANIDDDFAWTANTAVDFTLKNGWVLRAHSIRRLKNGGIRTAYGLDEIEKLTFQAAGYTNAIESDIGKVVVATGLGASDRLVDFDNTKRVWYVRTSGTARSVSTATSVTITSGTGAGTTTGTSVGSTAGEDDLWTNINTIGDLASTGPQPLMYVYTGSLATGDFNGNARKNAGYEDDPDPTLTNADRGVLDVLIRIKDMGTTLGNPAGEIRVYGRQGLDKFADFPITITAGGRIAVPIAQSNDTEDTIGEKVICVDGRNANDFTTGEIITWTGNNSAEVVTFIEGANSTNGVLIYRGATAHLTDGVTLTGATSGATGVTRGSAGGQLITIDAETSQADEADYGNVLTGGTSGAKARLRGHLTLTETGTGQGYLVVESNHDYKADNTYYLSFSDNDVITGTGVNVTADFTTTAYQRLAFDLDHVQPKLAAWDLTVADSSTYTPGLNVTQSVTGAKGTVLSVPDGTSIIVSQNNSTVFTGANNLSGDDGVGSSTAISAATRTSTFSYALPLQSSKSYWGLINCNGATAAEAFHYIKYFQQAGGLASNDDPNSLNADDDYTRQLNMMKEELGGGTLILQTIQGEEFFRAFTDEDTPSNNPTDQSADSRLAVKPGTSITTGAGWALINIAISDANNYTLTATDGSKNAPFKSVNVTLSNLVSGDHIQVVLNDGLGQEKLDQFNVAAAGNTAGDADIVFDETLPNDTPTGSGENIIVKVVNTNSTSPENKELRYRGTSYTGSTVTFATGDTGTATSAGTGTELNDTGIGSGTLQVGDVIRNTTDLSYAWIKSISANQVITTQLTGGSDNTWQSADNWVSNVLAFTHDGSETAYIPYIDRVVDAATETETITFVTNRSVVIRVRNTSIIDFDTTSTINDSGMSVGAVRNPDTVYA